MVINWKLNIFGYKLFIRFRSHTVFSTVEDGITKYAARVASAVVKGEHFIEDVTDEGVLYTHNIFRAKRFDSMDEADKYIEAAFKMENKLLDYEIDGVYHRPLNILLSDKPMQEISI